MAFLVPIQDYFERRMTNIEYFRSNFLTLVLAAQVPRASQGLWLYDKLLLDDPQSRTSAALVLRQLQNQCP